MLMVLTIDRFISIKKPLHYSLIMTPGKIIMMVLFPFFGAGVLAVIQNIAFKVRIKMKAYLIYNRLKFPGHNVPM